MTVAALLVAAAGFVIQIVSGVVVPTVPPGLVILLVAAALVAFAPWRWMPIVGVVAGLFLLVGFFASGAVVSLLEPSQLGVFLGAWIQFLAVTVAIVTGSSPLARTTGPGHEAVITAFTARRVEGPRSCAGARRDIMDREGALVETRDLTKRYGSHVVAVDRVSLTVRRGEVYGFLGPNGAGKTTSMRMLLGLIRPTSGAASVLDRPPGHPESLARIGALVESPAFYPYLSGMDNLRVVARYAGVPKRQIEEVLQLVDLTDRARDKFATYSLGMKQRLGVAAALMKDPELLILDEPTNGLDPAGMADMRDLIRRLGSGERTVLLSSHLLGEVEQICNRVGIISGGRLIAESTVEELRGKGALLVGAKPLDHARARAEQLLGVERVQVLDGTLRLDVDPVTAGQINRELVDAGVEVTELRPVEGTLEEVFLEMTDQKGESNVG